MIILLIGAFVFGIIAFQAMAKNYVPVMNVEKLKLLDDSFFVYFSARSSDLKESQHGVMDRAIDDIKLDATRAVYVIGNCKRQKRGAYSYRNGDHTLAGERAQAVANYLMEKGIPDYSIFIYENGSLMAGNRGQNDCVELYFK